MEAPEEKQHFCYRWRRCRWEPAPICTASSVDSSRTPSCSEILHASRGISRPSACRRQTLPTRRQPDSGPKPEAYNILLVITTSSATPQLSNSGFCNSTTQVSSCFMSFHFMRPQCRPMQAGTWEAICRASWTHRTFKTKFLNRHCMSYLPLLPVSRSFLLDFCNSFCKQTSSKHAANRQPMVNPRALALPQQREQWS